MKSHLMHPRKDFDIEAPLPPNVQELIKDLELDTLFKAMAEGDDFVYEVSKRALLQSSPDRETIVFRQAVLSDFMENPLILKSIYGITIESQEAKRNNWFGFFHGSPASILHGALDVLNEYLPLVTKLRDLPDSIGCTLRSEGLKRFFAMLKEELNEEYVHELWDHILYCRFADGVEINARLGDGNEGTDHYLSRDYSIRGGFFRKILKKKGKSYSFSIHPHDDAGVKALDALRTRGILKAANALAQAADHIESFLKLLQAETAFYIGCLNLHDTLKRIGLPFCFPLALQAGEHHTKFTGLYEICLALHTKGSVVGNDLSAEKNSLTIITGANQGGKSTFLRSIGLAQLMMHCGMFVPATSFEADICSGVFTHYRRKEDREMKSGKFDEELGRMSIIADQIAPHSLILFNESFAATNEHEGSEIARQIIKALMERGIKVFFVTHLYAFAESFIAESRDDVVFLRAERKEDGKRTFRILPGRPSPRSYGEEVYYKVFKDEAPLN